MNKLSPQIDYRLRESSLPYATWARNGIKGDELSNSENYLLELLNASEFFQRKSVGQTYVAPVMENNGQCDAKSDRYEIDFKTLISSSMARAKSNTEFQINKMAKGIYITVSPKDNSGQVYRGNILLKALRKYTCEELINGKYLNDEKPIVKDIRAMLKWLDKGKNLMIFLPSRFYFDNDIAQEEKLKILKDAMQHDAYKLFELRNHLQAQFETFLCTALEDKFIVFGDSGNQLIIVDIVDVDKCPTFKHLVSLAW